MSVFDSLKNSTTHLFSASTQQQKQGEQLNLKNKTANKIVGAIVNSECIPCGGRVNLLVEMEWKNPLKDLKKQWKAFMDQLKQILQNILQLFDWDDEAKFVDLCAVVRFFDDFVCVPDLLRIGSILMALMGKISFDFNFGMMSIILNLAGLLLKPFLDAVIDAFMKYMELIVAPIRCILGAIQTLLRKLDFQSMLQNIGSVQTGIKSNSPVVNQGLQGVANALPFNTSSIIPKQQGISQYAPGGGATFDVNKLTRMKAQADLNKATTNLNNVNQTSKTVNGSNASEVERFKQQQAAAEQQYKAAAQRYNDANYMKNAGQQINKMSQTINSLMFTLEGYLHKAVEMFYSLFDEVIGELRKLEGEFVGLAGSFSGMLMQKLQMMQLIELVNTLYDAFIKGEKCVDESGNVNFDRFFNQQQSGVTVVKNPDGSYELRSSDEDLDEALQNFANNDPNRATDPGQTPLAPRDNTGSGDPTGAALNQGNLPIDPITGAPLLSPSGGDPNRLNIPNAPNISSGTGDNVLPGQPTNIDPRTGLPDPIDRSRPLTPSDKDPARKVFSPNVPVNDPYFPIANMLDGIPPSRDIPTLTNEGLPALGQIYSSQPPRPGQPTVPNLPLEGVGPGGIPYLSNNPQNKPFATNAGGNPFAPTYGQAPFNTLGPLAKDPTNMPQIPSKDIPGGSYDNTKANQSRKKLKSLLQSTGDPVLDADLARIAESIETPRRVVVKCQLANSVADAERINKWIQELNQ